MKEGRPSNISRDRKSSLGTLASAGMSAEPLVMSDSLRTCGLYPTRLLRPWDSPGKSIGVSCHSLLQGSFLTQGSNPRL